MKLIYYKTLSLNILEQFFFGSKPDKNHENKLKKKFIDLQKIDPTISNPFNINN